MRTMTTHADVSQLTTRALLRLYSEILTELNAREVIRSRNAPAGDLAERLVQLAYHGQLAAPSVKGWDVIAGERRLQVKSCVVMSGSRARSFSPFRSWGFDACVFVTFDALTYDVMEAIEVPIDA